MYTFINFSFLFDLYEKTRAQFTMNLLFQFHYIGRRWYANFIWHMPFINKMVAVQNLLQCDPGNSKFETNMNEKIMIPLYQLTAMHNVTSKQSVSSSENYLFILDWPFSSWWTGFIATVRYKYSPLWDEGENQVLF